MQAQSQLPERRLQVICLAVALLALPGFTWIEKYFAPKAEPWPRWEQHNDSNQSAISHQAWSDFLERYVQAGSDDVNRVAYRQVSPRDRKGLNDYVAGLAATKISGYRRSEQLAYWINLYNAHTVQLVLEHHPIGSIRDIKLSPGILSTGPWNDKTLEVEGQKLSLNDIEHRILRPGWRDNRLHYALNCASIGCPNLQKRAFTPANTDLLLEQGAIEYVNHSRGVEVQDDSIKVSKIYLWFSEDFGGSEAAVVDHLRKYASPELKRRLDGLRSISEYRYDWSLNDDKLAG